MKKALLINGPNLNMLGKREPDVYGKTTLEEIENMLTEKARTKGIELTCKQSNHEGDIIDWLHEAEGNVDAVIINPGAFTHYSYAIRDAIAAISVDVIEVHISNIHNREAFRQHSVIAPVSKGQIVGFGIKGYELALEVVKGGCNE
ncbi:type II 3-dehydroquinate dehydratase [Aliibacillus thermotolerans]|uniref:3-dehydroquinate dehydratase n=1 Tax=Aliibacillus thermotolerans TaxID=1834418 RepID=A0ABW0UA73_9BACI|nr:type II 3-dehydroquinate dehydratase [Aliibacillus thermotolerans]MDA3131124.1 type II 3-dehydroquinate dehydratase [Aliibacillus thermotolerans]